MRIISKFHAWNFAKKLVKSLIWNFSHSSIPNQCSNRSSQLARKLKFVPQPITEKPLQSSFANDPKGLENCSDFVCLFFLFSGRSPRRQTSKMTVWEISFNPREFFSPSFFCFSCILRCFLIYFVFFFGVITKNFYWRSSHHHYNGLECAFFVPFSSLSRSSDVLSIVNAQHEMKNSFFNFSTLGSLFAPSRSGCCETILESGNIRRNERWIIQKNRNEKKATLTIVFTYEQNSVEIWERRRDCSYHYTKCMNPQPCESQVDLRFSFRLRTSRERGETMQSDDRAC